MRSEDLEPAISAIRDGGWGDRRPELTFYLRHRPTTVFVAEQDADIVGTAIVTLSAGIGWLGLVFVAPALRGHGLGSRLTRTGLECLRDQGSRSILLAASDLGRPIYEKLGFVVDGHYSIVFGRATVEPEDLSRRGIRSLRPSDLTAASALDGAATGEDRRQLLEALGPGWVVERDGRARGYAFRSPWGFGPAIAEDEGCGRTLLDVLRGQAEPCDEVRLMVPQDNRAAMNYLADAGFEQRSVLPRMRLGESVAWQPSSIWALVNASFG
jgi:ribosomal protein S18 acetylase RimI-like enzyme